MRFLKAYAVETSDLNLKMEVIWLYPMHLHNPITYYITCQGNNLTHEFFHGCNCILLNYYTPNIV